MIANAGILGIHPFRLGSDIRVDDGKVEAIFMEGRSRFSFMAAGFDLLTGNYCSSRGLRYRSSRRSIILETEPPTIIKADGEFVGRTPLVLTVIPRAVRIIAPPVITGRRH